MNMYKKPIIAFFAMLLIQAVVSVAVLIPGAIYEFMQMAADGQQPNPDVLLERLTSGSSFLSIALIVSSIITIFFMQTPMKMIRLKDSFSMPKISLGKSLYLVLAAFIGIFATDVVSEVMDLPNIIEAELGGMSKTVMGVLAIAIIGPLAEEVVFRGAIQQHLHTNGERPFRAIFIASVLFGLMHMNPAQIPFAFVVGLILGVFYWKTGSLVLPCIIHMLNNGISCWLSNTMGDELSFVNALGGTTTAVCVAVVGLVLSAYVLYGWATEKE